MWVYEKIKPSIVCGKCVLGSILRAYTIYNNSPSHVKLSYFLYCVSGNPALICSLHIHVLTLGVATIQIDLNILYNTDELVTNVYLEVKLGITDWFITMRRLFILCLLTVTLFVICEGAFRRLRGKLCVQW